MTTKIVDIGLLNKILKNNYNFRANNYCPSSSTTKCCDLFNRFTSERDFTWEDNDSDNSKENVNEILKEMNKNTLKNQAIYLLYQLAQCSLQLQGKEIKEYNFGTWTWFKNTMVNSPLEKILYFISLLICLLFFCLSMYYIIYKTFKGEKSWIIYTFILSIFLFSSLFWGIIQKNPETYDKSYGGKYKQYEKDLKERKSSWTDYTSIYTLIIISILIGLIAINLLFVPEIFRNNTDKLLLGIFIALLLSFNLYYMILIPQIVIIIVILQWYILSTPLNGVPLVVKIFLMLVIIFASLYDTKYNKERKTKNEEIAVDNIKQNFVQVNIDGSITTMSMSDLVDMINKIPESQMSQQKKNEILAEASKNVTKKSIDVGKQEAYNKPIWFTFGIISVILLININCGDKLGSWDLMLTPLVRGILNLVTKDNLGNTIKGPPFTA